jgi:cell division transport system permease protein
MTARIASSKVDGLLPTLRAFSVLPMLIAIMVFLTALALAGALSLTSAAEGISRELSRTLTVQIVHSDRAVREREARAAATAIGKLPGVASVKPFNRDEIGRLLEPWLGAATFDPELPLPALVDVTFQPSHSDGPGRVRAALGKVAPHARIDEQSDWLEPLSGLLSTLRWLGLGVVSLVVLAMVGTVVLATRAALNTHRETIEVMHLMGATDGQISRLFERRSAFDGFLGGVMALAAASLVLAALQARVIATGSGLLGSAGMPAYAWAVLAVLPLFAALLAALTARLTVFRSLSESL